MIDVVKLKVKAGDGGDGRVSFLHLKYKPKGGPDGGDGGDGGDVWITADTNYNQLSHLTHQHEYLAESGQMGGKNKRTGKSGQDIIIPVPPGTWVWHVPADFEVTGHVSQKLAESGLLIAKLENHQEKILIAKGGKGGRGNWHFRSATNQTPQEAEKGTPGEDKTLVLELKLIADAGLIGLPNAGKSSLLIALSSAKVKVADYPFTTLSANLGVVHPQQWQIKSRPFLLADIPGLIEGASQGKGLGYEFLRHIQRSRLLIHLIEPVFVNSQLDIKSMMANYDSVRQEISLYGFGLDKKPELKVISKSDLLSPQQKNQLIPKIGSHFVSINDRISLKRLIQAISYSLKP